MKVLLTFTGFHDPYSPGLVGQVEQAGPILSLLSFDHFDRVILFSTPNTETITAITRAAIQRLHATVSVEVRHLALADPTDYFQILQGLRRHYRQISAAHEIAEYFVALASGTPQMHACWLLLAASGEIPARLLHIRPPRFVTRERPMVTEVDLSSTEFPQIRIRLPQADIAAHSESSLERVICQLGIVGDHPKLRRALETAGLLAPTPAPVLILGETGTGKELIARLVHRCSGRPLEKLVAINCAAIPKDLVESLLFGHKKGSFTGATSHQKGKFDLADGGTLFLDELAELPWDTQAKLLRVIQDGMVEPLGAHQPHRVNVRIIAATNKNIKRAIRGGKFREDLYYRLNVGEIIVPPLRERRGDIPKIALHVLEQINAGLKTPKRFSVSALARLQIQAWPGNVRDLQNAIERSALLCPRELLEADDLLIPEPESGDDPWSALPEPHEGFELELFLSGTRKQLLLRALEIGGGNQSRAAKLLGITPQAVHKFLRASS